MKKAKYKEPIVRAYYASQGLPAPTFEFQFHPERKWRFDMAWPKQRVALEVEGGIHTEGRHTRGAGFLKDMEKYNTAARFGWRVIRCTPDDACMMETVEMIHDVLRWEDGR